MQTNLEFLLQTTAVIAALSLSGCSSDETTTSTPSTQGTDAGCPAEDAGCPASNVGTENVPPTGSDAEIRAWIAKGDYKAGTWECEGASHAARPPSPHGTNRICSNATLTAHGSGAYPVDSAGVKEIYNGTNVIGHALYRKVKAGTGAESWFWWEELNGNVVASGTGEKVTGCSGCHGGAPNDYVFTQVK